VVFLSLSLEFLTSWVQRRFKRISYARLEWNTNGTLQLQRLAYEELGIGEWVHGDHAVPITKKITKVAPLDISNIQHLIILSPWINNNQSPLSEAIANTHSMISLHSNAGITASE
jgi:hypothetical protein